MTTSVATPLRRFRFGLRSLFLVVTLISAWCGYQVNWIRQRHALLKEPGIERMGLIVATIGTDDWDFEWRRAPAGLWLFGERGVVDLMVDEASDLERAERLFPEAHVYVAQAEDA